MNIPYDSSSQKSSMKPVMPVSMCVNMIYEATGQIDRICGRNMPVSVSTNMTYDTTGQFERVGGHNMPVSVCVNKPYDTDPFTSAERMAARVFIDSVGGLVRAMDIMRDMQPLPDPKKY